jgi:WD40 repeat protein
MDRLARSWHAPGGEFSGWRLAGEFSGHTKGVSALAVAPERLYTGSSDGTIRAWPLAGEEPDNLIVRARDTISALSLSHSGGLLAWASYDGKHRVLDLTSGVETRMLDGAHKRTLCMLFSPDDARILTAGLGDEALIWPAAGGEPIARLAGHGPAAVGASWLPGGLQIATASYGRTLRVWSSAGRAPIHELPLPAEGGYPMALSPDGLTLAVGMANRVRLYRRSDWSLQDEAVDLPKGVYCLAWSPDGRYLAMGAADRRIRAWEVQG